MSKERPILFNGDMVRAILEGRKTQTRRIIKNATGAFWDHGAYKPLVGGDGIVGWHDQGYRVYFKGDGAPCPSCPFGQPGDLLWGRETWARGWAFGGELCAFYRADGTGLVGSESRPVAKVKAGEYGIPSVGPDATAPINCKWNPSIHMPRWASRLTLEITNVRVERLKSISQEDAKAEGAKYTNNGRREWAKHIATDAGADAVGGMREGWSHTGETEECRCLASARSSFINLWESVHGPGSWDANPWLWVIEFRKKEVGKEPTTKNQGQGHRAGEVKP